MRVVALHRERGRLEAGRQQVERVDQSHPAPDVSRASAGWAPPATSTGRRRRWRPTSCRRVRPGRRRRGAPRRGRRPRPPRPGAWRCRRCLPSPATSSAVGADAEHRRHLLPARHAGAHGVLVGGVRGGTVSDAPLLVSNRRSAKPRPRSGVGSTRSGWSSTKSAIWSAVASSFSTTMVTTSSSVSPLSDASTSTDCGPRRRTDARPRAGRRPPGSPCWPGNRSRATSTTTREKTTLRTAPHHSLRCRP